VKVADIRMALLKVGNRIEVGLREVADIQIYFVVL
jgi:hypothetical protein